MNVTALSKEDVWMFYQFLVIYEKKIKRVKADKEFQNTFPSTLNVYNKVLKNKVNKKTKKELMSIPIPNDLLYITVSKTLLLDYFRHLRNSLAHVLLNKLNPYYEILDYYKGFSAKGRLKCSDVKDVINTLIQEYIEKYSND